MNGIVIQLLAALLLAVPTSLIAVGNTWPSYTLKTLESADSPLGYRITKNEANLIGSVVMLGSLTSIMIVGCVSDKIGRKKTEILCGLCYALAWSIIATAKTVTQILIGRYIIGFGTGFHFVTGLVYTSEIAQPSIRGSLVALNSFMYNIGTLASYTEGWFCSYDVINYLNLTTAVVFVLLLLSIKETPVFLLRKGRDKEAINSLKFYRGEATVTQGILDEIVFIRSQLGKDNTLDSPDIKTQLDHEKEKLNKENEINKNITKQKSVWSILMTSKSTQRALITLIIQIILSVCMGMIAVQAYAGQFFAQAAPSLSPHLCSVLLAVVMSISCGLSVLIVNLFPRRVLMISTSALSSASLLCLATMLRWEWAPEWGIPLVMVSFCILYHLGAVNIPFVQITECLLPQMNNLASSIIMCCMFLSNFTVLFVFKPAIESFGLDGVFLIFAIISFITAVVSFLITRETRNVPFDIVKNSFEQGYLYRRQ